MLTFEDEFPQMPHRRRIVRWLWYKASMAGMSRTVIGCEFSIRLNKNAATLTRDLFRRHR